MSQKSYDHSVITLKHVQVRSLTSVSTTHFLTEIMFILKVIKYHFKGLYDKQNLTLVAISYEIYELAKVSFHKYMKFMNLPKSHFINI